MTTIVAEAGVNWKDLDEAFELIRLSKESGADKVKFQCYNEAVLGDLKEKDPALFKRLMGIQVDRDRAQRLFDYGITQKIEVLFTPMYPEAVDFLETVGVQRYKIREADGRAITGDPPKKATPLIQKVLDTNKPVYISVKVGPLDPFFKYHPKISYLYCLPKYPAPPEELELYWCKLGYGYSNHYPGLAAPQVAITLGAPVVEVHVTKTPTGDYIDGNVSLTFSELERLVKFSQVVSKFKLLTPMEQESKKTGRF